jgi:hypothetical protein
MKKEDLNLLKVNDIYSLMLFAIYKMKDIPEYATLSELSYVLKKDSLLNFFEYFGGTTIKVPTMGEFKVVIKALMLYQYVKIENIEFNKAVKMIDLEETKLKDVKQCFCVIGDILDKYDFKRN